ncbi:thiamine diphosphate-binding protein [Suillus weaverae]|nr:thiamine diphosphate-binding protein [Suillus weaverae]
MLTWACSNGRTLSTLPASTCLPTIHSPAVSKPAFFNSVTGDGSKIPNDRVLDVLNTPIEGAKVPEINEQFARRSYENMQLLQATLDDILCRGQRQGRIPFYYGEEATVIDSAADDNLYRETGVLLWRGFTLDGIMAQVFRNHEDSGKGRQIAVYPLTLSWHYGSKQHHPHTISSPLATQIPQATGRDALKMWPACFFRGRGSIRDFHAGMLLASTVPSLILFLARDNGFAISTPNSQQFYSDGISVRGPDGNDVLAAMNAVKEARRWCLDGGRAVLVEMMTYMSRERQEVEDRKKNDEPITRFCLFKSRGCWNETDEEEFASRLRRDVIKAFKRAGSVKKPDLGDMFTDKEQREELVALLKKYGQVWEPWQNELGTLKGEGILWVDDRQHTTT